MIHLAGYGTNILRSSSPLWARIDVRKFGRSSLKSFVWSQQIRTQFSRAAKKIASDTPIRTDPAVENANRTHSVKLNNDNCPKPADHYQDIRQTSDKSDSSANKSRADHISKLFPKFMRNYANRIKQAPVSHITSFLIIHELSAVIPLFALWWCFYQLDYVPSAFPEWIIDKGVGFIRNIAERNDWTFITNAERKSRLVLQGAAAYAFVKASMPLRLIFSVWFMPYFARWFVIPMSNRLHSVFRRFLKRSKKQ